MFCFDEFSASCSNESSIHQHLLVQDIQYVSASASNSQSKAQVLFPGACQCRTRKKVCIRCEQLLRYSFFLFRDLFTMNIHVQCKKASSWKFFVSHKSYTLLTCHCTEDCLVAYPYINAAFIVSQFGVEHHCINELSVRQ